MICASRTEEPPKSAAYNQSPNALSNDLTTNQDLNGLANSRELRRTDPPPIESAGQSSDPASGTGLDTTPDPESLGSVLANRQSLNGQAFSTPFGACDTTPPDPPSGPDGDGSDGGRRVPASVFSRVKHSVLTFGKFVGPGFMIAVAYSKPGDAKTFPQPDHSRITYNAFDSRSWQLLDRHRRWSNLPLPPAFHCPFEQPFRYFSSKSVHQTGHCQRPQPGRGLSCLFAKMAQLLLVFLGRGSYHSY